MPGCPAIGPRRQRLGVHGFLADQGLCQAGIKLVHFTSGKPQDRGKIERSFRTFNSELIGEIAVGVKRPGRQVASLED